MTDVAIADTPDALTPAWFTAALGREGHLGGATVVDVVARPLGTGQMCDSVRVELAYDGPTDAPTTLVAKLPAADPTSRATAQALRSYEKEVRFYQQLAADLPVATPRALHADIDPATARFVLLLDDMAPARAGDQLTGCDAEAATSALDQLVHLQAPRWGDPALEEVEWLAGDPDTTRTSLRFGMPMLWAGFKDRYAADLGPDVLTAGEALFGAGLESYTAPSDGPRTITHGDYRLDNLLFDDGGQVRAVVDWQTCTVGPGLADVAYFLGAGLEGDERRACEEDLVRRHHRALEAAGVSGYPWERCWEDYRLGTFAGLVVTVGASMLVERTTRGDAMFMAMASRHSRHALDLDAPALLAA